ncbi:hypothetical protein DENSPDRAFT_836608 [Dentipellis sp. KUC8613]|nr:hypothetical protein DENSPDRAFT_836608 [Dentipellis sp. KUC8613]
MASLSRPARAPSLACPFLPPSTFVHAPRLSTNPISRPCFYSPHMGQARRPHVLEA